MSKTNETPRWHKYIDDDVMCPDCHEHTSTLNSCCSFLGDDVVSDHCECEGDKQCALCHYLDTGKLVGVA